MTFVNCDQSESTLQSQHVSTVSSKHHSIHSFFNTKLQRHCSTFRRVRKVRSCVHIVTVRNSLWCYNLQ